MGKDKVDIVQETEEETGNCENVFNTRMYSGHKQCQCMDCGKSFTRKSSLIVHQRIHTGEKLFMCSECGKRFGLKSSMVRHMRTHTPKTLKICPDCGKCFSRYSSLFQHQKVHRKERLYRCPHCEKSFSQASQLLVHQRIHKRRPLPERADCEEHVNNLDKLSTEKNIVCPECGKYFKGHRSLLRHQRIHKESTTTVPTNKNDGFAHDIPFNVDDDCNVPRSLQTVNYFDQMKDGSLYAEKKTHEVQKRVLCIDCGKSFTRKSSLIVHQRIHTGEKMFMCSECGKRFGLKSSMVRHMRIHSTKVLFQQQRVYRREKPYKCLQREKSFSRASQRVTLKRHHKVESHPEDFLNKENDHLDDKNAEESYKCLECGKCFRRRNALIRHQRIHKGNSYLYNTQNTFFDSTTESGTNCSTSEPVYKDDTEVPKQEQSDVTEKSNRGLDKNSYIVIKLGNNTGCKTSSEIKSILCMDCGKCFTRKSSLIVHQRIHTGEKLFMCTDCGRRFSLKSSLVRHMRTHSPKILNICSDCGKCFSRYSSLFQHQKVHRREKTFKCPQCEKSFSRASQLLFHRRIHKVESYSKSETGDDKDVQNAPNHYVKDNCAEEPHVCLECGKHFTEKHLSIRHQRAHIGNSKSFSYMDPELNANSNIALLEAEGNCKTSSDIGLKKQSQVSEKVLKRECAIDSSICKSRLSSSRRPHHCIQCGKSFTRKSSLIVHHIIHTGEKRFICTECGKRFGFKSSLVRHLRTHTGQMLNICSECGIYFSRYRDLLLHLENHMGQLQFTRNALSEAEARDEQWQFNMQQSLSAHTGDMTVPSMKEQESGLQKKDQPPYSTGYLLPIASSLNDCFDPHCEEKIQDESLNIKEETSETLSAGQLQFTRNALSKAEARDEQWQLNMQQSLSAHTGDMTVPSMKEQESGLQKKDQPPYSTGYLLPIASSLNDCFDPHCEEKIQDGSLHIKEETSENLSSDGEPPMRQKNEDVCTHTLSWGNDLNISESFTEECSEKTDETIDSSELPIINVLNNHNLEGGIWNGSDQILRRTQPREKRFLCSECGKNFTRKSSLIVHQRTHTGEKLFMCSECGKRFGLKSSVVRHMRTHNAEHFKCMVCGKNFRDYSKFLEHQTSHSGEFPYTEPQLSMH